MGTTTAKERQHKHTKKNKHNLWTYFTQANKRRKQQKKGEQNTSINESKARTEKKWVRKREKVMIFSIQRPFTHAILVRSTQRCSFNKHRYLARVSWSKQHIYHIRILQAMTLRNRMENLHKIHEKGNVNLMNENLDLRLSLVDSHSLWYSFSVSTIYCCFSCCFFFIFGALFVRIALIPFRFKRCWLLLPSFVSFSRLHLPSSSLAMFMSHSHSLPSMVIFYLFLFRCKRKPLFLYFALLLFR